MVKLPNRLQFAILFQFYVCVGAVFMEIILLYQPDSIEIADLLLQTQSFYIKESQECLGDISSIELTN